MKKSYVVLLWFSSLLLSVGSLMPSANKKTRRQIQRQGQLEGITTRILELEEEQKTLLKDKHLEKHWKLHITAKLTDELVILQAKKDKLIKKQKG